jgi:hypothetical protein
MPDPIRMFVGCAANNEDLESQAVLEWSVRKHSKREVLFHWMQLSRDPDSAWHGNGLLGWQTRQWTTPFSGFRWAIAHQCCYEGRAIYSDSDVIYMADIGELWDQQFLPGKVVMAKGASAGWRYCVSMWDCAAVKPHLPGAVEMRRDPNSHSRLMRYFAEHQELVQPFKGQWNCLDGEGFSYLDNPRLKALHYTHIATQPQLRHAIPRLAREGGRHWFNGGVHEHRRKDIIVLFDKLLEEATKNGFGIERYRVEPYGDYNKKSLVSYGQRASA